MLEELNAVAVVVEGERNHGRILDQMLLVDQQHRKAVGVVHEVTSRNDISALDDIPLQIARQRVVREQGAHLATKLCPCGAERVRRHDAFQSVFLGAFLPELQLQRTAFWGGFFHVIILSF